MNVYVNNRGLVIDAHELRHTFGDNFDSLLAKLTIKTEQKVGRCKVLKMYQQCDIEDMSVYLLPRYLIKTFRDKGLIQHIHNLLESPKSIDYSFEGELVENQELVINHLMNTVYTDENAQDGLAVCTINLSAGFGKTFVAAGMINKLRVPTLYIVPNKDLLTQAVNDLRGAFPSTDMYITVLVINTVMLQPESFFSKFGLIIMDEIHKYCSPVRSGLFWRCQCKYMLGMSATTDDRLDKFDEFYHRQFGKPIHAVEIPNFDLNEIKWNGDVYITKYAGKIDDIISPATGKLFVPGIIKQLVNDPQRNDLIIEQIIRLHENSRNIFVFSEYREHLDALYALLKARLNEAEIAIEDDLALLRGGIKTRDRSKVNDASIILTTYGYSSTGISIPKMDSIVFATPRKNGYIQICARIMRRGGNSDINRIIIDIVDTGSAIRYQAYVRSNVYSYYGFNKHNTMYES